MILAREYIQTKQLYKFRSIPKDSSDPKKPDPKKLHSYIERIFLHNELYFPSPIELNDPLDCRPLLTVDDLADHEYKAKYIAYARGIMVAGGNPADPDKITAWLNNLTQEEVEEYIDENGKSPFREWILSLKDTKTRARIRMRVNRLRLGNFGDCRFLGNGVYELKIDLGPGYRIYLGRESDVILILLCGGDKKNQSKDIVKAKKFWQDYVRRRK